MNIIFTLLTIVLIIYIILIAKDKLKDVDFFEYKTPHIVISILLILLFISAASTLKNNDTKISKLEKENKKVTRENIELNAKVEDAKEYLDLDVNEKQLVDDKIKEVNEATKEEKQKQLNEKLAKQKAEREAEEKKKAEEDAAKKAQEEADRKAAEEAEAHKYESGITWEDMARDSNGRSGEYTTLSGQIIQVMNGDGYTQYRLAVDGDYDKVVLIQIDSSKLTQNILEDDYITVKGKCTGNISYKTVLGAEQTVPSLYVDSFSY